MRKLNAILSAALLAVILLHGIMGSFMLLGVGSTAGKILAWSAVVLLVFHGIFGVVLTVQTLRASKQSGGKGYWKQNALFWTRRTSGVAILILLFFHFGLFGEMRHGTYVLHEFTTGRLIAQLLLIASLFLHIFVNIRPLLVSLGVLKYKERRVDLFLILSVLVLFMSAAVVVYYIGWQYL